jgi:DNA end-binding protein Ku
MAPRAIASATVSFGLVSIPVKLYSATESSSQISFNLLHKKCGTRVRQQYFCPSDEEIVARDEMVKGYEFAKDQYVTFTPEEIQAIEEPPTKSIDITEFVPADSVDMIYADKPYYLGPDKGGDKAYRLLAKAMEESGRFGLAKYAARGKQYLVLLRPREGALVMQQIHYADEVRPISEVPVAEHEVKEKELQLARQLIDQIASDAFHPEAYKDEVRERIQQQIQRKVEGQEIAEVPPAAPSGKIIDLMEALKASLSEAPRRGKAKAAPAEAASAKEERKPAKAAPRRAAAAKKKAAQK